MLAAILSLFMLASLTPRQEVYLLKQIMPDAATIVLLAEKPDTNPDVAQYVIASPPYQITLIPVEMSSIRKAPEVMTNTLSRYSPDIVILSEDKIFEDPMILRLIVSQALAKNTPVMARSSEQIKQGATFSFSSSEDGKIVINFNPVSVKKLKITFPENETFVLNQVSN